MGNQLIEAILSENVALRNRSINLLLKGKDFNDLLRIAKELEEFRVPLLFAGGKDGRVLTGKPCW